jgi:hypothetical protein
MLPALLLDVLLCCKASDSHMLISLERWARRICSFGKAVHASCS